MSVKDTKSFDIGEYNETVGNFLLNACTVRAYFDGLGVKSTDACDRANWHEKSKKMDIVINLLDDIILNSPSKYEFKLKEEANADDDDDDVVVVAPRCKRQAIDLDAQENDNEAIEARNQVHNIEEDDERPTRPPSPVDNENKEASSSSSSSSSSSASSARSLRLPSPPIDIIDVDDDDNKEEEEEEDDDDDDDDDIVLPSSSPRFHRIVTRTVTRNDGTSTTFTFTE